MERESKGPYWPDEGPTSTPEGMDDLTEAENLEISQLVKAGHSLGEARQIIAERRKKRDEKALNEDISPQRAERKITEGTE